MKCMEVLLQLFREEEIKELIKTNEFIEKQSKENISRILKILFDQKCTNNLMRNIIKSNPFVLTRDPDNLEELIYKLKEYGIIHIDIVADTYPYILNKNAYEIDTFFFKKMKEGKNEEEAKEILESEPYLIDEE